MTDLPRHHPQVLCSLVIIRDASEQTTRSAIRSTALFTVTRCQQASARFAIDHATFDRMVTRASVLDGIVARIPKGATVIARASRISQHYLRHSLGAGGPLPPADLQLLQRERGDLDILPIECANSVLEEIAAAYRIERAGPASNIRPRSRRAPDEAQTLWLAFLWSQFSPAQRNSLSTAWEAWRALERARPVGF